MHFLYYWLGLGGSGVGYAFWSGIGSDLGEFTILVVLYRKMNCHQDGCWRIGLHKVKDTPLVVCRKHHDYFS